MGKTIGYCRVSTEDQANKGATSDEDRRLNPHCDVVKGYSIESQQDNIRGYCTLHDLGEPEFILDEGFTGKNVNRPGLQQVIELVKQKEVEHVVVVALDRLSRSTIDCLDIVLNKLNGYVAFHSVREQFDTHSPTGKCMFTILAAFANLERDNISARTREALQEKIRRGERVGRNPYGFNTGGGELTINHETLPVVKEIFTMREYGASYQLIANKLNERNVEAPRGKKWYSSSVKCIVENRAIYRAHIEDL